MISIEEHWNGEILKEHTNSNFLDNLARQKTLFSSFVASTSMHEEKIKNILSETSSLFLGDAKKYLDMMPDESVQSIITSPPYWALRDYNIDGQIGLEESVYKYVDTLADLFDQAKRVLRNDGTFWLNIGDSYTSGGTQMACP